MERKFNKGDIVQHFKREKMTEEQLKEEPNLYLYEIIGTARPLEMFMSEVDHEKYPEITQKYRFELKKV